MSLREQIDIPEALLRRLTPRRRDHAVVPVIGELDTPERLQEAKLWLIGYAPEAHQNHGGDATTYRVAQGVKDRGISETACLELMSFWNDNKAFPPWTIGELAIKVSNAYAYGTDPIGISTPEAMFAAGELPVQATNGHDKKPLPLPPLLTVTEWRARDLPPPDFLCGNWLTTTSRVLLVAPTGLGKTMFGMGLTMAVSIKRDFLHWKGVRPAKVLFIDGEMSRRLLRERIADEADRLGVDSTTFFGLSREDLPHFAPLNTPPGQAVIEHYIKEKGGFDLIQFDNIMSLIAGDQKDEEGWRQTLPWALSLTQRRIGQIWVHHTGHDEGRSYGTKTREWQMDTVIHLDRVRRNDTDVSFALKFKKARERTPRYRNEFRDVGVALVNNRWIITAAQEGDFMVAATPEQQGWITKLTADGDEVFALKDMIAAWGVGKSTALERKTTLCQLGLLRMAGMVDSSGGRPITRYEVVWDNLE